MPFICETLFQWRVIYNQKLADSVIAWIRKEVRIVVDRLKKKYRFPLPYLQTNNLAVIEYISRVFADALCMEIWYFVKHIWPQKQQYVILT